MTPSVGAIRFPDPKIASVLQTSGRQKKGTPSDVNLAELRSAIEAIRGVAGVHDLHVWSLASGVNVLSVHGVATDGTALGDLLSRVGDCASHRFRIAHATVQIEPPGWKCGGMHE